MEYDALKSWFNFNGKMDFAINDISFELATKPVGKEGLFAFEDSHSQVTIGSSDLQVTGEGLFLELFNSTI